MVLSTQRIVDASRLEHSFGRMLGLDTTSDESLRRAFDEIDRNRNGTLDKSEIGSALRKLGKTDQQIFYMLQDMAKDELDFDEFKALVVPPSVLRQIQSSKAFQGAFGGLLGEGELTEEKLRQAFDAIDTDRSGQLDRDELKTAMRQLGKTDEQAAAVLSGMKRPQLNYDEFKALLVPPTMLSRMKNAANFQSAFGGFVGGDISDEALHRAFDDIDTDGSGFLDRAELSSAMKSLGKTDAEVNTLVDGMDKDQLNFDEFKALVVPPSVLARMRNAELFSGALGGMLGGDISDEKLVQVFKEIDTDGSGSLDKSEIATAMRKLGKSDGEVQKVLGGMDKDQLNFIEFKALVVPPSALARMRNAKVFQAAFGDLLGDAELTDEKLRAVFDRIDTDKSGQLDRAEIRQAMMELGKTGGDVDGVLASMGGP